MEKIQHSHVEARGLKLHVAQIGNGIYDIRIWCQHVLLFTNSIGFKIFLSILPKIDFLLSLIMNVWAGDKVVVFLHGFPEIWYTWRHQLIAVANAGYRAIAIDFRGYGLSDQPSEPEKANFNDLVDDVVGLLDSLGINKVVLATQFSSPLDIHTAWM